MLIQEGGMEPERVPTPSFAIEAYGVHSLPM